MKHFTFTKSQLLLYVVLSILLVILISTFIVPVQAFATVSQCDVKLLFIVDNTSEKPIINDEQADLIECKKLSEVSSYDNNHIAYAVSKSVAENDEIKSILRYAFNNFDARVYVYGELTISEFKHILNINTYSVETDIHDENGITGKKAHMSFSEEQEANKLEQIICLSNNPNYQSLMASVPNATYEFLESIIANHYCDTFVNPKLRATIVYNRFNYRNYVYPPEGNRLENCYLNMDLYLYKIEEENVEDYDYYAIRVNVCPVYEPQSSTDKVLSCTSFNVEMYLERPNDNIFEYGPYSSSKAKDINVSLGFGDSGISGSVGFTFSPGSGPSVETKYYPENKRVTWEVKKHWFFGSELNNAIYPFGVSWAAKGGIAAIRINICSVFEKDYKSLWTGTNVRFV